MSVHTFILAINDVRNRLAEGTPLLMFDVRSESAVRNPCFSARAKHANFCYIRRPQLGNVASRPNGGDND